MEADKMTFKKKLGRRYLGLKCLTHHNEIERNGVLPFND